MYIHCCQGQLLGYKLLHSSWGGNRIIRTLLLWIWAAQAVYRFISNARPLEVTEGAIAAEEWTFALMSALSPPAEEQS